MAKLFLYSLAINTQQCLVLNTFVQKNPEDIHIGIIENAADIIPNAKEWLGGFIDMLIQNGYHLEPIDLKNYLHSNKGLEERLNGLDLIWMGGGHTYYLNWILQKTGADVIIKNLVKQGLPFAGWSAGAIIAGPTTLFFDQMKEHPAEVPEKINIGLCLTQKVIVPHIDHAYFSKTALKTNRLLMQKGFETVMLRDNQVWVVDGTKEWII